MFLFINYFTFSFLTFQFVAFNDGNNNKKINCDNKTEVIKNELLHLQKVGVRKKNFSDNRVLFLCPLTFHQCHHF
jgi:hypothetical protein